MRRLLVPALLIACSAPSKKRESLPLAAEAVCHPTGDRCAASAAPDALFAGYRKDFFFPYSVYPEASIPDPTDGGRIQIAGVAKVSGTVQTVFLSGVDISTLYGAGGLDWFHVWPTQVVAGKPIWVAFHSHDPAFDTLHEATLQVTTDAGDALNGRFPIQRSAVELVSVSSSSGFDSFLLHLHNADTESHRIDKLLVNGLDLTSAACIPQPTLRAGETTLIAVPLCQPTSPGQAWTVVLQFADAMPTVATGRVLRPFFPIETWPSSSDCPFPGEENGNYEEHVAHGLDTFFVHSSYSCPISSGNEILQSLAQTTSSFTLPERDLILPAVSDPHVAARFCGDESDNERENTVGAQDCSKRFWAEHPEIPTYVGGSRSRYNGAFAGTTDIQGMDFYVCACAPHITDFGALPPFRGAYDYTIANRKNHAPLPTWTYTQGFSSAWDVTATTPDAVPNYRQVTPAEMRAEAMSVVAGGAKGLMYFQTKLEQAHLFPDSWEELSRVNHDLIPVRDVLASGAATGLASADERTIVEAIRGQDAIVVPAVSLAFENDLAAPEAAEMNDVLCGIGMDLHWKWASHTTEIRVEVPADFGVADVFEIRNGVITPVAASLKGRTVTIPSVLFDESAPARMYVLAASSDVTQRIASAIQPR